MRTSRFRLALVAIAAGGGVARVLLLLATQPLPAGDGFFYPLRAQVLAHEHVFTVETTIRTATGGLQSGYRPSAGYPPLWTTLLAIPASLGRTDYIAYQLTGVLIGVATIVVIGFAAKEVAGPRVGLIAAAIAALYPGFWSYERSVLSETLLLLVLSAMVLLAYRYRRRPSLGGAILLGAAWMVCTLTRAEQLMLWPLVVAPLVLTTAGLAWRNRLGRLAIATLVGLAILAPWTIYNAHRFERPVLLSNGLGNTMLAGACDAGFSGDLLGYYDPRACVFARPVSSTDEVVADAQRRSIATSYLRDHASEVPLVVAAREGRSFGLYRPVQTMDLYMTWSGGSSAIGWSWLLLYWVLLAAAVGGVVALRRRHVIVYPLLAGAVTVAVATALTFGFIRYRAAAEVGLVVLAAVGIDAGLAALGRRRRRAAAPPQDAPDDDLVDLAAAPAVESLPATTGSWRSSLSRRSPGVADSSTASER